MTELLPHEDKIRWILERSAEFHDAGIEPVAGLVLPTGKFFPDHFERSVTAVKRLLKRVVKHAGLTDLKISANVVVPEEDPLASGGGCSTGGCSVGGGGGGADVARVEEKKNGWQVNVLASELGNPMALTTGLVRGVSHVFMRELDLYKNLDRYEAEPATDLCGVLMGFGVLLCNGAYIYKKG